MSCPAAILNHFLMFGAQIFLPPAPRPGCKFINTCCHWHTPRAAGKAPISFEISVPFGSGRLSSHQPKEDEFNFYFPKHKTRTVYEFSSRECVCVSYLFRRLRMANWVRFRFADTANERPTTTMERAGWRNRWCYVHVSRVRRATPVVVSSRRRVRPRMRSGASLKITELPCG